MKQDDPFERTNAASGTTLNDGEAILAAVREQHRAQLHHRMRGVPMTHAEETKRQTQRTQEKRR